MESNPGPEAGPDMDPSIAQSFVQLPPKQLLLATTSVMLAIFLSVFSQTIVATAMPRIIAELGGFDQYTWPATAYLVATAVAVPIVGRLSDIYGRRVFLILGLVIFTLCSIPAGLSQSMNQLVASRLLQGIGGGLIAASSFAAGADLFAPQDRGRFEAYAGLTFGIAAVAGPLLGGFITDRFAWNWIFLLNVPVGLMALAIVPFFPKIRSEVTDRRLDYPGMAALVLAVASIMAGLSWGNNVAATATGLVAFAAATVIVFVIIESKSPHPIMPLEIYRNRTVAVSLIVVFLSGFGLYGSLLFTPLFFQGTLDMSAADSGSVLAPIMVGLVVGSVLSGQLIARAGGHYRAQAVTGSAILAAGLYLLSAMDQDTSLTWGMGCVFVAGIGVGSTMSTLRLAIQNSVPFRLVGAATSALQFCRLLSGTVGLAVLGVVLNRSLSARLHEALPEGVKAALPTDRLDAIKNDPRSLLDPVATDTLTASLEDIAADGSEVAQSLVAAFDGALAGAVAKVFVISTGLVALSFIASMFLRIPRHDRKDRRAA